MSSVQTRERRIAALEARLADIEGGYGDILYHVRRASIKSELRFGEIFDHLHIDDVAEYDVDNGLDRGGTVVQFDAPVMMAKLGVCPPLRWAAGQGHQSHGSWIGFKSGSCRSSLT